MVLCLVWSWYISFPGSWHPLLISSLGLMGLWFRHGSSCHRWTLIIGFSVCCDRPGGSRHYSFLLEWFWAYVIVLPSHALWVEPLVLGFLLGGGSSALGWYVPSASVMHLLPSTYGAFGPCLLVVVFSFGVSCLPYRCLPLRLLWSCCNLR